MPLYVLCILINRLFIVLCISQVTSIKVTRFFFWLDSLPPYAYCFVLITDIHAIYYFRSPSAFKEQNLTNSIIKDVVTPKYSNLSSVYLKMFLMTSYLFLFCKYGKDLLTKRHIICAFCDNH